MTCSNPNCYCGIEDCSKRTDDISIPIPDEIYATSDDFINLLDSQRDIVEKINLMKLADYSDVQLNTQVKDLKHMLEMVLMKLQFWDYEHEKTLSVSANHPINAANTVDDECELVMLDNEVAHSAIETSQISGEEELDAILNTDDDSANQEVEDDIASDLVIDAEQIDLPTSNSGLEVDEDIIDDVDLELEPVEFEDDDTEEVGEADIEVEVPDAERSVDAEDVEVNTSNVNDGAGIPGFRDILADENGNAINFGNIKDLLSMLFTMSMATDSESIINTNGESYGNTTTNYPPAPDPDELD